MMKSLTLFGMDNSKHVLNFGAGIPVLFDTGANVWLFPDKVDSKGLFGLESDCQILRLIVEFKSGPKKVLLTLDKDQLSYGGLRDQCPFGKDDVKPCTVMTYEKYAEVSPSIPSLDFSIMGTNAFLNFGLEFAIKAEPKQNGYRYTSVRLIGDASVIQVI